LGLADGVGVITNKGQKPSWTIGLDYKASDQLFLYGVSRRGYRNANVNTPLFETPFTTGGTGCNTPSGTCPDLRPFQKIGEETVTDFELGMKSDWTAGNVRGRVNLAGFWSKYKNALQFFNVVPLGIPRGAPDFPTRQSIGINAADETIKGLEFDATLVPVDGLTLSLTGAYTDSRVDKVNIPPIGGLSLTKNDITLPTPRFAGTLGLNWVLPVHPLNGDLVFNADYFHTEKFGAQVGRFLPAYEVVNTRIAWNGIAGTRFDTAVYARNMFGEKYFLSPSNMLLSFPTNSVYAGERRTWGLEVQYSF
jgi:iron complex outermembrane receptor protein